MISSFNFVIIKLRNFHRNSTGVRFVPPGHNLIANTIIQNDAKEHIGITFKN